MITRNERGLCYSVQDSETGTSRRVHDGAWYRYSMTDEELVRTLAEWAERLGLLDWDITVSWRAHLEEGEVGVAEYTESTKSANIYLLTEEGYGEYEYYEPYDAEHTLVHELLHLKLSLLCKGNDLQTRIAHQLIDDMARALVDARRSGGRQGQQLARKNRADDRKSGFEIPPTTESGGWS